MRIGRLAVVVAALTLASTAQAKLSLIPLADFIQQSDVIVVATVSRVEEYEASGCMFKRATASVREALKGDARDSITYIGIVGGCDHAFDTTVDAKLGETVLLFLHRQSDGNLSISAAGRGRMPLRIVLGIQYADYWEEVFLPKDAPVIPGPDPRYSSVRSVRLDYLKGQIATQVHPNPSLERP